MNRYKKIIVFLIILILSGCWDRVEIEDRGFVIGLAIDVPMDEEGEKRTEKEEENKAKGKARFLATYQFVIPGNLQGGGGSGGGGAGEAFINLTSEGDTLMEINRIMATRSSRSPYLGHLKIIVISEEVARSEQFANVMDFPLRDHEFRRTTQLMIAKDKARDVLEVQSKLENLPIMYIQSVAENSHKTARMIDPTHIGDVHDDLLAKNSYVIQRVVATDTEVKVAGSAIFLGENNTFVGWLGEEETEGLNFLKGEIKGGFLKVQVDDNFISYEIKGAKNKIEVDTSDKENLKFTISMAAEGTLPEALETEPWLEEDTVKKVQQKVGEEIERIAKDAVDKLHKDFKTDAIGLGQHLSTNYPDLWETIKNDWETGENYFSKSEIKVEGKAIIRNSGVIIKSEPIQD